MGLPVEVNSLMMGSSDYNINRSLRFRSSASAYLNRTPASAGNRRTWTWSGWVKRGSLTADMRLFEGYVDASNRTNITFESADRIQIAHRVGGTATYNWVTTAVYRDPSAWYHIILAFDTTQATTTDRIKLYVNGIQVTVFGTQTTGSQNVDTFVNSTNVHSIGRYEAGSQYFDGYLAEVNFIDGTALTTSSFGAYDTNGVWQPKKYTGTYGTNGFYLPFSNTTSTTTLVQDSSGNGNNWTPNNISLTAGTTYDSMIDSPTVNASASNYATWNPIFPFGNQTLTNGNLSVATGTTGGSIATISVSSGKWYWEVSPTTIAAGTPRVAGLVQAITAPTSLTSKSIYLQSDGKYSINGAAAVTYGGAITTSDIVGVALDADAQTVTFYKNGSAMGSAISISSVYTSGDLVVPAIVQSGAANNAQTINFGQRPFTYTPPTGFNALNIYNLPTPSIANGAQYMAATTYTGNGSTQTITNGGNNTIGTTFQPDFIWMKSRNNTYGHNLFDSVRGGTKRLVSNLTDAELTVSGGVNSFNTDGMTIQNDATNANINASSTTYIGWQWKAGGTGVTNTSGTITSTVSANTAAGFSVVTYTGNGSSSATVGHGLGVTPNMIFVKCRSAVNGWFAYHSSFTAGTYLQLNSTSGSANISSTSDGAISTSPTSSTFGFTAGSVGVNNVNQNTQTFVAYCFAAVSGYSAFGLYAGNGSTDGPFVYLGFRPRFVLIKKYTSGAALDSWEILDTSRNTYNLNDLGLYPNTSGAEASSRFGDILSNGFKLRFANGTTNESGYSYIYAAFAENPFKYSRAR